MRLKSSGWGRAEKAHSQLFEGRLRAFRCFVSPVFLIFKTVRGTKILTRNKSPNVVSCVDVQDEIREVVAFAEERFITVMPEIEIPGHSQVRQCLDPLAHHATQAKAYDAVRSLGVSRWYWSGSPPYHAAC